MELIWNETPQDHWQAFMDVNGGALQQSWAYGETARTLGAFVHRFELRNGDETIALAQGIERRFIRPITLFSMAPVCKGPEEAEFLARIRSILPGTMIATPGQSDSQDACHAAGLTKVMTPASLARLSLATGLRARMHGKWRNRLHTAEAANLTVRQDQDESTLSWLLAMDRKQQKSRRYRALPDVFTQIWHRAKPQDTLLLTAGPKADPIAAMLFLKHGTGATYHVGWTSDAGRKASAHNLILATAATRLAEMGVTRLDLGTIDTENAPGLARFKLGSGAKPVRTGGTWLGL